jgi:hypothetical protein
MAPDARAAAPDRSEVVLVFDLSASILRDATNRNRFGAALERIAARVDETSSDLVAGDARVSIVVFAAKAADYQDCAELKLLDSPETVARFSGCLRSVANAYRKGLDPALTAKIGTDTNYVAAMEQAAKHLPPDAVRPALILFSDGKHDVAGVPASQVQVVHDRLFGSRTPLALLPVGMGLDPKERDALEAGLLRLKVIRAMPPCVTGTAFDWPQVVFESPDEAGNAVAVALQDATCTFTVAPTPAPSPTPSPAAGSVRGIRATALDSAIELRWTPPATATATATAITDYQVRCGTGDGQWIESNEGVSTETRATVERLVNGTAYNCEVAAVSGSSVGPWTPTTPTTPIGRPGAPPKPAVEPMDRAVRISVSPNGGTGVSGYHYECSRDNGGTWPNVVDAPSIKDPTARIGNLTNGAEYVCRAFANNAIGQSDPSPVSDAVKPCGSIFQCNGMLPPILAVLGFLLVGALLAVLISLYRDRNRGHVVAVVDVVHVANLGHGRKLGITFVRAPVTRLVTGIVADPSPNADVRIRVLRGGRFAVTDRLGRHVTTSGEPIVAADSVGLRHQIVLHAFATRAASPVSSRR